MPLLFKTLHTPTGQIPAYAFRTSIMRFQLASTAIVFFLRALKLSTVGHGPRIERLEGLLKGAAERGDCVFDADRYCSGEHFTVNEAISLQTLQCIGKRFVRDPVKPTLDLVEA